MSRFRLLNHFFKFNKNLVSFGTSSAISNIEDKNGAEYLSGGVLEHPELPGIFTVSKHCVSFYDPIDTPIRRIFEQGRIEMKQVKRIFVLCIILLLTSCQMEHSDRGKNSAPPETNPIEPKVIVYENYNEAYRAIIEQEMERQAEADFYGHLRSLGRANLYDCDGDGQDELMYVNQGPLDVLYVSLWTFKNGAPVLLLDEPLGTLTGIGTGGINIVEYEGLRYLCGWAYNSAPWETGEANMYYDCFLWEYPDPDFEPPYTKPSHTFGFRYFLGENGEIREDAFSFLEDNYIARSIQDFRELKNLFIDHPLQVLCEADIIQSIGLSFEEIIAKLQ